MDRPHIVETKVTRPRATPKASPAQRALPVLWGALFLLVGLIVWSSGPRKEADLPEVWRETSDPARPDRALVSATRGGGRLQGNLLRMEWPAHPGAESYLVRFRDDSGHGPAPVPVQSTVFLYDLESDVLHLPSSFKWEVTAVLEDGSQVVTPARRFPEN